MARRSFRRFKKYPVAPYLKEALSYLMPPEDITVSQWAEKNRMLTRKSSSADGPWSNEKTPYLVGIMDELNNYGTEEVIFVKPAQIGGTEALLNCLGWVIHEDPAPTMLVYPSDDLGESIQKNRIMPMVRACPELMKRFHPAESNLSELQFDGMYCVITGSNSPSQLASRPIRYLFMDEVDKFTGATKKEADPVSLARERTKTFRNRKIFLASTPTVKTGHIWKAMESADEIRHYFVPCPHCGKYIEFKFSQIKFPSSDEGLSDADRAEFAVYNCQECNGIITDRHKPDMLSAGEWRTVSKDTRFPRKVAFWINTIYSPFVRFSQVAAEFLGTRHDPERFQNFTNSWLAEPWEDTKLKTNADTVMERQTDLPEFVVPEWAKMLTAGVDVQETSVYYTIRAWGNYLTSQCITHGQVYSFSELERAMNLQYAKQNGEQMVVSLALVDSGDNTDVVYGFCADNSEWAIPSKGSSHAMDTHFKISKVNRTDSKAYGMQLAIIDTAKYKDMIAGRMKRQNGSGAWMVYKGTDREYAEQVTAEHKVNVKSGGRVVQQWVPKSTHADNHYLDCEVYAMCAADMLGVRTLHLQEIEKPSRASEPEPQDMQKATQESNWIGAGDGWMGTNENWLGG